MHLLDTSKIDKYPERATFCVDWDGTCVEEVWPGMGDWLPGAIDALDIMSSIGITVIYSLRCHEYEQDDTTFRGYYPAREEEAAIRAKLDEAGLHDVRIYPNNRGKPPAQYYIDDRAVRFENNWPEIIGQIMMKGGLNV